jgi:hypothetical protein
MMMDSFRRQMYLDLYCVRASLLTIGLFLTGCVPLPPRSAFKVLRGLGRQEDIEEGKMATGKRFYKIRKFVVASRAGVVSMAYLGCLSRRRLLSQSAQSGAL